MPKKKQARVPATAGVSPDRYKDHAYMNPDGSIDAERLLKLVAETPGAFLLVMAGQVIKESKPEVEYEFEKLIERVITLQLLTIFEDENAKDQIKAIEKIVSPEKFEMPRSKIKELATRYETTPSLARAWELRQLMSSLTAIVEPIKTGQPYSASRAVKMRETLTDPYFASLWKTARPFVKINTTLQALAMHVYLQQLKDQGVTDEDAPISHRSLKRDLEAAGLWEKTTSEDQKKLRGQTTGAPLSEGPLIWYRFSEGWKDKRRAAQLKQQTRKKGGQKS